jgi:hypothetical protein
MTVKLGDLLLKAGVITQNQLEEALKYQVIFGGKLGTNLIEMGVVDEDDIARALSSKHGVPAVDPNELSRIPPEVIHLIPAEDAARFRVVPLRLDGRRLTVAMAEPVDFRAIDEIAFRTGLVVRPQVAAEVRIVFALEQHYGIERERRYIHAAKKIESPRRFVTSRAEEITSATAAASTLLEPPVPPEEPIFELEEVEDLGGTASPLGFRDAAISAPAPAPVPEAVLPTVAVEPPRVMEEFDVPLSGAAEEFDVPLPPATEGTSAPPAAAEAGDELFAERLVEARDRDDILGALADRLAGEFSHCAILLLRGNMAMGWRCLVEGRARPDFDRFQLSLEEPSVLKTVAEAKSFSLGPVARTPGNIELLQAMGGAVPEKALLVPLLMMGRVVGILYVDGTGIDLGERLFELQKLIAKAAMAFEILVLKNKILSL